LLFLRAKGWLWVALLFCLPPTSLFSLSPDLPQEESESDRSSPGNSAPTDVTRTVSREPLFFSYSSLGFLASTVSGVGLSYRYHTSTPWLFQITAGALSVSRAQIYDLGAEVQYELSHALSARFFLILGAGIYGSREVVEDFPGTEHTESSVRFHAGTGIGMEIALGDKILDALSLGISLFPLAYYNQVFLPGISAYFYYNW